MKQSRVAHAALDCFASLAMTTHPTSYQDIDT